MVRIILTFMDKCCLNFMTTCPEVLKLVYMYMLEYAFDKHNYYFEIKGTILHLPNR